MKAFLTIVLAIALGLGAGYGFFAIRSAATTETFPIDGWPQTGTQTTPEPDFAISNSQIVNLGTAFSGKIKPYQVYLENVGDAPGEIWVEELPPSVRLLDLELGQHQVVPANSRYLLNLGIVGEMGKSGFEETLLIKTNQQRLPQLFVKFKATIYPGIGILPNRNVLYTSAEFAERKPAYVHVVTWLTDQLDIQAINFSSNPDLFRTEILELSEENLADVKTARAGKTIRLTPQGDYPESRQKITMSIIVGDRDIAPLDVAIRFGE